MAQTRTGTFPVGFRRGWSEWQKDLAAVIRFAKDGQFAGIDVGPIDVPLLKQVTAAGLRLGSVDLKAWPDLCSPDAGKRKAAAELNAQYVKDAVAVGARNFFVVVLPEDPARARKENFKFAVDGYGQLGKAIADSGAKMVIEGWPGGGPHFPALCCTPADYRAFLKEVPEATGINFDPSHLVRMGIDPVRFLGEFAPKVFHVHGKDTEILDDQLQEHGNLQPATFAPHHGFGAWHWRYTIPGHGQVRWAKLFAMLADAGYNGMVSIELEDENFNGSEEGEKRGFLAGRDFLCTV